MRYRDRQEAGAALAEKVTALLRELDVSSARLQVLALPRGGIPVARPIADRLGCPLRILLVRKLGLPAHPELAIGAIAAIGSRVFAVRNDDVLEAYEVDEPTWDRIEHRERDELARRSERFGGFLAADPAGQPVLLVDDGLATGATMRAAAGVVGSAGADPILIAAPIVTREAVDSLARTGARVVWLTMPDPLVAVGAVYRDFHQLTDDEVLRTLGG